MNKTQINQEIVSAFGLAIPPVAMAFVDGQPDGVSALEGEFPSYCTFWRMAEEKTFYAPADKHYNCPDWGHDIGHRNAQRSSGRTGWLGPENV